MSQIINNITNEESPRPLEHKLTVTQYKRICAANVPLTRVASTLQYVDGDDSERDIIIDDTIIAYQAEKKQEKKEASRFLIGMGVFLTFTMVVPTVIAVLCGGGEAAEAAAS